MIVKIIDTDTPTMWYAKYIDEEFEVENNEEYDDYYIVVNRLEEIRKNDEEEINILGLKNMVVQGYYIKKTDCIVIIGYCKECGSPIFESNEIDEYRGIYECPSCFHPHLENEVWHTIPDYLKVKNN